ncbi:MAG: hypothetical protein JOY72_10705 [Actinobacteria bacterium]|nr:hypothetical protein [Actinomycetota bacterium]MBV8480759.1 hypothetical protein [Actinomycetota bacterium]
MPRRALLGAAVLAALVVGVSAGSAAAPAHISGAIFKSGSGYELVVFTELPGMTDVNFIVTGGSTVTLTKPGPHCKVQGAGTVDCSPDPVPVGKPVVAFGFKTTPALSATNGAFLTLDGSKTSAEIKLPASAFKIASNDSPAPQDRLFLNYDYYKGMADK